ncbi:hypothetical protein V1264_021782 [Littorina saxatilis]
MAGKTGHKTVDLRMNGEMEALKQRMFFDQMMADMAKENSSTLPPPPSKNNPNQKFLIFTCRSSDGISGGWGDRQKGMVNAFLLATVTNRRFGIVFNEPCDLRQFYVPNEYNWDVPELQNKSWKYVRSIDGMTPFRNDLYHMDFNEEYPQDVIFLHTNNEHYKAITLNPHYNLTLPVWAQKPLSLFFHDAWNMLFKPTRELQNRVDSFLHKIHFFNRTKPLVGFHVRIGKSSEMNDFSVRNHKEKLGPVWDFVGRYVKNGSQVFLATDNNDIRNTSRVRFGPAHHDTEGVILHIDTQKRRKDACQGFNDLIVEQLMLTHCDILVKSRSGFSRRAVMMRGGLQEIFVFRDADIRPESLLTVT